MGVNACNIAFEIVGDGKRERLRGEVSRERTYFVGTR